MHLKIVHNTRYSYPEPIRLDLHYLKFYPLDRPYLRLNDFRLRVCPDPAVLSARIDTENNHSHQLWVSKDPIKEFSIDVEINLDVEAYNPFDFLLPSGISMKNKPFAYPAENWDYLKPYMGCGYYPEIQNFVDEVQEETDDDLIRFLMSLIVYVCQFWSYQRKEGHIELDARECFNNKTGSCKELAWMLMIMLRGRGLASRFVSGYAFNPLLGDGHELHAWVEVLLPGAGWVGLDPSAGLFTNEYYIPIATSFHPDNTMPVTGYYLGPESSRLETNVSVEVVKS